VFLAGLKAGLVADQNCNGGEYLAKSVARLKAFGRIYAGWAFSQAFYREQVDIKTMGFASADAFLEGFWDPLFQDRDPNNLLAMLRTWQLAEIAAGGRYRGDFHLALKSMLPKAVIMPSVTDLYFPVADSEHEAATMLNAVCAPIPTVWGHVAGNAGANPPDTTFVSERIAELLAS
jgi:homoserine O-acetyltransferase